CNSQQAGQLTSGQREFRSIIDRTAGRSGCVDRVACLVKSPTGNVELKLQTYFSSYSHGHSRYKWASFAKASGLRAISTLNNARRESVKFARKCECGSGFFAPFDTFGRYDPEWASEWRFFEADVARNHCNVAVHTNSRTRARSALHTRDGEGYTNTLFHEGWLDVSACQRAVFVVQTSSSCMGAPSKTSPVVGLYSGREA
ncbi:hypothetical protein ALC60_07880, partial [Trachymyrmex zeteki]